MHVGRLLQFLLAMISTLIGLFIAFLTLIDKFKSRIILKGWIRDDFAVGNLQASGNWTGFESLIGILFIFVSLWFVWNLVNHSSRPIKGIFVSSAVLAFLSMVLITPRIEAYSQGAAIEFYRSVAGKDAYITTLGFKSYAHLFYSEVNPPKNISAFEKGWFLTGDIDKEVYVVFKINRKARYLKEYPDLKIIYEKNGFVFSKREPK